MKFNSLTVVLTIVCLIIFSWIFYKKIKNRKNNSGGGGAVAPTAVVDVEKKILIEPIRQVESAKQLLYVGTQNFGGLDGRMKTPQTVLYSDNSSIKPITEFDICAIQELAVPDDRWTKPAGGSIESFGARTNATCSLLVLASAMPKTIQKHKYQHSFGLFINPNLNFKIDHFELIKCDAVEGVAEIKGAVVVTGRLYGENKIIIAGVHGVWNKAGGGYDNPINRKLILDIFEYAANKGITDVIVAGDTNLRYSAFKVALDTLGGRVYSDLDFSAGTLVTAFDGDGFANPDHMMSTRPISMVRTRQLITSDHLCLYGYVEFEKTSVPLGASNMIKIPEANI